MYEVKNKSSLVLLLAFAVLLVISAFFFFITGNEPVAGGLILVAGVLKLFVFNKLKDSVFKDSVYLYYGLVFKPGLLFVFMGIWAITMREHRYGIIHFLSGIAFIFCILTGLVFFYISVLHSKRRVQ